MFLIINRDRLNFTKIKTTTLHLFKHCADVFSRRAEIEFNSIGYDDTGVKTISGINVHIYCGGQHHSLSF